MSFQNLRSPHLAILVAASLWGTLGVSYAVILRGGGVDPVTLVTLRLVGAAVVLLGYAVIRRPAALRLPRRDWPLLGGIGVVSFAVFYIALVYAFQWTSVPVATVLLYTAPVWVAVGEHLFLGYRLERASTVALACAVGGAALVADLVHLWRGSINLSGIGAALLSAVTYATFSVLGKRALRRLPPLTVLVYGLGIGAICLLAIKMVQTGPAIPTPRLTLEILAWPCFAVTVLPVALYTLGLRALRPSTAAILATFEPVVAVALSAVVLAQRLGPTQIVGALLVVAGAVYLSLRPPVVPTTRQEPAG